MSSLADGRHRRDTASSSGDTLFRGLAPRGPRLAQKCGQRDVGLVLKIENGPVFRDRFAGSRQYRSYPFLSGFFVNLIVFSLWFLVGQSSFAKPSPNRVFRYVVPISVLDDRLPAALSPNVRFLSDLRSWFEDQFA